VALPQDIRAGHDMWRVWMFNLFFVLAPIYAVVVKHFGWTFRTKAMTWLLIACFGAWVLREAQSVRRRWS